MDICRIFLFISLFITTVFYSCSVPSDEEKEEESKQDDTTYMLPWEGETDKFSISAKEGVHLNDPQEEAGTAYVTIPSTTVRNTRWEFDVHLTFNPSANNYARFYLASSSQILSGETNGYFIQIGGTKDNVALYRQNGTQQELLASGRELMKGNSSPKLYIKVECDGNGYWTFWTRLESETEYIKEKQTRDAGIQSSVCCGIYCVYTKSRRKNFTFHHIAISNDVETTTSPGETPDEPETDIPDTPETDAPDIPEESKDVRGMLLFNEIMYDNAANGAEYIEIYNPGEEDLILPTLYLYKMNPEDGKVISTTILNGSSLPLRFEAKSYLCFTKSVVKVMQKHNADSENLIEITNFPQLNNNGGCLGLSDSKLPAKGHTFDTCLFNNKMHGSDKRKQGLSLEKISPELPSLNKNWHSSSDITGGTPGIKNSEE